MKADEAVVVLGLAVERHHRVFAFSSAAAFESVITADPAMVIVAGEAVVGKTRLVQVTWPHPGYVTALL